MGIDLTRTGREKDAASKGEVHHILMGLIIMFLFYIY